MKRLVILLVVLLLVLHQDFWWWDSIDPLVFGFLPIGLAYHVALSIVTAIVLWLAVTYCWPAGVDVSAEEAIAASRHQRGEL